MPNTGQPTPRARIKGVIKYPLDADHPPIEVWILPKDFGKRGLKGGGVDRKGYFKTTIIPDAYSAASEDIQQDEITEESGEDLSTYRVQKHGDHQRSSERFLFGGSALRISETLPVNESVASRLDDARTSDMVHASIILDLMKLGCVPTVMEEGIEVTKKYTIVIPLGVPANDLKDQKTIDAAQQLKGRYSIEQCNVKTGKTSTWDIEIVNVILEAQAKGTVYTATRKLDGRPAVNKTVITVVDVGGGDMYKVEINLQGGQISTPERIGDGSIAIARPLQKMVEKVHGIQISEIEAQEALYRKTIWKGGEEISIASLIEELRPRFADLLTKLTITNRMMTTFIIFTGGGAALLEKEIRAKLERTRATLQEGTDFLIMPASIAAVANCIGLFAIGYYKIQKMIRDYVAAYIGLKNDLTMLHQQVEQTRQRAHRWPEEQSELAQLQQRHEDLRHQVSMHVGQYYPEIQQQILAQRQRQQQEQSHLSVSGN
jgi:hypothetical protein